MKTKVENITLPNTRNLTREYIEEINSHSTDGITYGLTRKGEVWVSCYYRQMSIEEQREYLHWILDIK